MVIIAEIATKELNSLLREIRRIEAHRAAGTEYTVRKLYRELLSDLKQFVAQKYELLGEDDRLTWEILQKKQEYARFIEKVEWRINNISPKVSDEIINAVENIYQISYESLVNAVKKSVGNVENLRLILAGLSGVSVETVKQVFSYSEIGTESAKK